MTSLLLPEHVARKVAAKERAEEAPSGIEKAYVPEGQRVLDPALLDKPLLDRLPQPTGWRVLVMPYQGKAVTSGGLHIPDEVRDREALATVVAYVLKVGPLAYKDPTSSARNRSRGARPEIGSASAGMPVPGSRSTAERFG